MAKRGQFKVARKFGGEWYNAFTGFRPKTKREANQLAGSLRKQGKLARVGPKTADGYIVYWRNS